MDRSTIDGGGILADRGRLSLQCGRAWTEKYKMAARHRLLPGRMGQCRRESEDVALSLEIAAFRAIDRKDFGLRRKRDPTKGESAIRGSVRCDRAHAIASVFQKRSGSDQVTGAPAPRTKQAAGPPRSDRTTFSTPPRCEAADNSHARAWRHALPPGRAICTRARRLAVRRGLS